jgi:homospermidine synthase
MLAGIVWMLQNPTMGYVEPEDLPFEFILNLAKPYLGTMASVQTNWTPIVDRNSLFKVDVDPRHPWRFENFRVIS